MADVFGLTKSEGRLLQMVIDHVRSHGFDLPVERQRPYPMRPAVRGVLMGPIEPPACLTDAPATVQMRVFEVGDSGLLEATLDTLTLTCFDPDLTGEAGAYCKAEWHDGVWEPYWVGCSDALADCEAPSSGGA